MQADPLSLLSEYDTVAGRIQTTPLLWQMTSCSTKKTNMLAGLQSRSIYVQRKGNNNNALLQARIMCLYRMFQLRPCPVFISAALLIQIPRYFRKRTPRLQLLMRAGTTQTVFSSSEVLIKHQAGAQHNAIIDPQADTVALEVTTCINASVTICLETM